MKHVKRPSALVSRKKARSCKKLLVGVRRSVATPCASIIRYNGVLSVLYQRDMKETDAAAAILANSDIKALKTKYARFERKS